MKKSDREAVYNKYGGRCAYCGKEIAYEDMQVDHIESIGHLASVYDRNMGRFRRLTKREFIEKWGAERYETHYSQVNHPPPLEAGLVGALVDQPKCFEHYVTCKYIGTMGCSFSSMLYGSWLKVLMGRDGTGTENCKITLARKNLQGFIPALSLEGSGCSVSHAGHPLLN